MLQGAGLGLGLELKGTALPRCCTPGAGGRGKNEAAPVAGGSSPWHPAPCRPHCARPGLRGEN